MQLIRQGALDASLAALLLTLSRHGMPLVVAGRDVGAAEQVRLVLTRDAGGGGVLLADSLDEVVRLAGGGSGVLPDELRDMGLVVVVRIVEGRSRVVATHYVRPLERDAGGHVQRRGPAVLATFDPATGDWSHFHWALTAELAERAGLDRHALEDEVERLTADLERAAATPK